MKCIGRFGHSCPQPAAGATMATSVARTRRIIIECARLRSSSYILSHPSPGRPVAAPLSRSFSRHAVLDLSPRAHGLDQAYAARTLCRGLACRADVDLYRRHVRHRRYRHGEDFMADHLRHEQAAIRQAGGARILRRSRRATAPSSKSGSTGSTSGPTPTRCSSGSAAAICAQAIR